MSDFELDDLSLYDMFRMEAEEQVALLADKLLALQGGASDAGTLRTLMRGAHSFKGAARIVGLGPAVRLTHALEERFVAGTEGKAVTSDEIPALLAAVDILRGISTQTEDAVTGWLAAQEPQIEALVHAIESGAVAEAAPVADTPVHAEVSAEESAELGDSFEHPAEVEPPEPESSVQQIAPTTPTIATDAAALSDVNLRITAQRFDRILTMASDGLVQSEQMLRLYDTLRRSTRQMRRAWHRLDQIASQRGGESEEARRRMEPVHAALRDAGTARQTMENALGEMDSAVFLYGRKSDQLHREVLQARLRPLADILPGLRRLIHDTSIELGKQVRFDVKGERTQVDRDILERLRAPLEHLVRNALDHGLETPAERLAAGKPAQGVIRLRARHENGRLAVTLGEDGRGIIVQAIRESVVRKGLVQASVADRLSEAETLEFLFLPGFSTRTNVTELSGRGFGLDVVQSIVHEAGGSVRVESTPGAGTNFHITLPVTRSIARVMRVEAEEEIYALPMVHIARVAAEVATRSEGGALTVPVGDRQVPVIRLADALGGSGVALQPGPVLVLFLLNDKREEADIAFAVEKILGDSTVAVRQLDARLGKLPAVGAVTLTEQNVPMLILEAGEVLRAGLAAASRRISLPEADDRRARVLVVDDSPTVRQMLRRTLVRARYYVMLAQHGAEAWSLLQLQPFDLLVSDVDMPEMNGIELVEHVRANSRLEHLPIILLSYKGREEDRQRGLQAGADAYVTKGEFEETGFLQIVTDLIGPAEAPDVFSTEDIGDEQSGGAFA